MSEIDSLKKLDPESRKKKLKELIEKFNTEITDKNKEIEEAKKLADLAEKETQELLQKIKIPELEEINVSNLFNKKNNAEDLLEEKISSEKINSQDKNQNNKNDFEYNININPTIPVQEIYSNMMNLYNQVKQNGNVTPEMAEQAGMMQYALDKKQQDIQSGNYNAREEIVEKTEALKSIADSILAVYTGSSKRIKYGI